jgi:hypothetical protein
MLAALYRARAILPWLVASEVALGALLYLLVGRESA